MENKSSPKASRNSFLGVDEKGSLCVVQINTPDPEGRALDKLVSGVQIVGTLQDLTMFQSLNMPLASATTTSDGLVTIWKACKGPLVKANDSQSVDATAAGPDHTVEAEFKGPLVKANDSQSVDATAAGPDHTVEAEFKQEMIMDTLMKRKFSAFVESLMPSLESVVSASVEAAVSLAVTKVLKDEIEPAVVKKLLKDEIETAVKKLLKDEIEPAVKQLLKEETPNLEMQITQSVGTEVKNVLSDTLTNLEMQITQSVGTEVKNVLSDTLTNLEMQITQSVGTKVKNVLSESDTLTSLKKQITESVGTEVKNVLSDTLTVKEEDVVPLKRVKRYWRFLMYHDTLLGGYDCMSKLLGKFKPFKNVWAAFALYTGINVVARLLLDFAGALIGRLITWIYVKYCSGPNQTAETQDHDVEDGIQHATTTTQ